MIYHLAEPSDWAGRTDVYVAPSLHSEGFIHFSTADQLDGVAGTVYPGRTDLLLLTVDEHMLEVDVIYEDLYEAGEEFPHVYASIPVTAIVASDPYEPPVADDA